ncbi:MAG TPA: PKD domain-containing protein [Solirubrobacterales bacterium]|nr:PKD domain-containing protein [Solirubrobacterales bacterium]
MRRRAAPALLAPALLCLLVGAAGPVEAAFADSPQVTIVTPGGVQHTLSLEALAGSEDVVDRDYTLRSGEGESSQAVTGFSIAALLEAAGVDPYGFSYVEVQRPGGGAVQLSRVQAIEPRAFAEGPPVVYPTGSGTGFLRPAAGPEDDNAADSFRSPAGLTIVMRKGASLQVRIEATPRHTSVGKKVAFRAVVERSGSGEALSYSWYFDDGSSGEGQTVTHAFAKPGSYSVVLGVTAAGEDTGTSAVVRIQVGKAPAGGPDRKGGGHDKSAGAPDHGAADGPSGPATPSSSSAPAAAPTPEAATPATVPTPTQEPRRPKPEAKSPSKRKSKSEPKPTGELVTGELLAGDVEATPPAATPRKRAAARTGTPRAEDGDGSGGGVPEAAWGLGAVAVLLGIGALAEAGGFVDLIPRVTERLR